MSVAISANQCQSVVDPPRVASPQPSRLRLEGLGESDRNLAVVVHLSALVGCFVHLLLVAPLVIWMLKKDKSAYVDDHGREMINVMLTALLLIPLLVLSVVGIPLAIIWGIVIFISMIRGAVAAGNGEYFRYPLTIRFLS